MCARIPSILALSLSLGLAGCAGTWRDQLQDFRDALPAVERDSRYIFQLVEKAGVDLEPDALRSQIFVPDRRCGLCVRFRREDRKAVTSFLAVVTQDLLGRRSPDFVTADPSCRGYHPAPTARSRVASRA